ncbi:MAG: nucleotidyltransferase domain-containing protein [Candidatus Jordarchaeum sp.]|uniref:nucleotidyltransferase domain-containing protein n=1 Tax=Candidatus Jordarchaeum sp. TaxID=2823881 RepID=UPI00404A4ACA
MAEKPVLVGDKIEIRYNSKRWKLLEELREKAINIMENLSKYGITTIVHGSLARGDVKKSSDVDVFIPYVVSSFLVEHALEGIKTDFISREIVQATPQYAAKGYIIIEDKVSVSFPMVNLRRLENEFYYFGGALSLEGLIQGERVPGVDKRLILIEPTEYGHLERPVIGNEAITAKILGVSLDIVNQRIRVLMKRDKVGRTGVYLKRVLEKDESFEQVLKKISDKDSVVRNRMRVK